MEVSLESVRAFFKARHREHEIIVLDHSSATVADAARSLHIPEGQVAKTLGFNIKGSYALIVVEGDARISNRKYKDFFKAKAKMMTPDELLSETSHPVGGVCPFGLSTELPVYLDISLKKYETVFPAAGAINAAIEIQVNELEDLVDGEWVDVCEEHSIQEQLD